MTQHTILSSGFGVLIHFLSKQPGSIQAAGDDMDTEKWNDIVDGFDVSALADQLSDCGARHLIFTITQLTGYMCTPNATYDRLSGIVPSKLSRRDLIADLMEELIPRGIRLFLYLATEGPAGDPEARKALGITDHWSDMPEFDYPDNRDPIWATFRNPRFTIKWLDVIREWSLRYGKGVSGWWIDGAYGKDHRFPESDHPNLETFTQALKSGNPDALVAYNPGLENRLVGYTPHDDYTSGEFAWSLPEVEGPFLEFEGNSVRTHVLSYLGKDWCNDEVRFPDELVRVYTDYVLSSGGTITWDAGINGDGTISENCYRQLRNLGNMSV